MLEESMTSFRALSRRPGERRWATTLGVAMVLAAGGRADAQVLGTFTWQTQPYCNVLTLTVVQQGGVYQATGADNLCGAGTAPVTGTIAPGGPGAMMGLTVAYPTGRAAQISAAISLATVSGTWSDADGNAGAFAFNGGGAGGARPAPTAPSSITPSQFSPTVYAGSGAAATVARSDHAHDDRYFTEAETAILLAGKADVLQVVTVPPTSSTISFVPEGTTASIDFTTAVAGRLDIRYNVSFPVTCTPDADTFRFVYLVLDGAPIRHSVTQRPTGMTGSWSFSGVLNAVTPDVIPAGPHALTVGRECGNANTAGGAGVGIGRGLSVVVLP
jgi:hypothetical protein